MTWGEALRLTRILTADGSSQVGATVGGWEYPLSREAQILADTHDAFAAANFKKPKPYPRPWDAVNAAPAGVTRIGDAGGRSRREIVAHLNSLGHHLPMPDDDEDGGDDG